VKIGEFPSMLADEGPGKHAFGRAKARTKLMTSQPSFAGSLPQKPVGPALPLLTPKEAAKVLRVSLSWLAKARMRGDGPPYIRVGRRIRYSEAALLQWTKSRQRLSTSER
jgi:excisionase family DNA binding protein